MLCYASCLECLMMGTWKGLSLHFRSGVISIDVIELSWELNCFYLLHEADKLDL